MRTVDCCKAILSGLQQITETQAIRVLLTSTDKLLRYLVTLSPNPSPRSPHIWCITFSMLTGSRDSISLQRQHSVGLVDVCNALQMKGRWESNINVWFRFMYSQKWNCADLLFLKHYYNVPSPNFYIHVSVSDLYIPRISLSILLHPNRQTDPRHKSLTKTWK